MVVWVEDRADTATVNSSSDATSAPPTGSPRIVSASSALSGLFRPMSSSPKPANDWIA